MMHRSPTSRVDSSKTLSALVMKPPSARTSPIPAKDKRYDNNDEDDNRTLRRLITNQPLNPARPRSSSSTTSLKPMLIEGQWSFREDDYDRRQLRSMGIANLVDICHEILRETQELIRRKHTKLSSETDAFQIVKLNRFKKLTDSERNTLRREKIFGLMTIVADAASTHASISQLVRIWREASEYHLKRRRSKKSTSQPLISYETAFEHLIRTPDDQLLQITLHASLLSTHDERHLRRLGRKLGVGADQFDMELLRDPRGGSKAFRHLIELLRKKRKERKREEQRIDTTILPYERKEKRGLRANVSGTKFRLVCQAIDVSGFEICPDADFTANLLWTDTIVSMDIVSALKPYQKVNHFPNMNELSQKDLFAKNYQRLANLLPKEYNFATRTWILPDEYNLWHSYASNKPKNDSSVYILKPTNSALSGGISIHCDYKQIQPMKNYIIQEYIREPLLIDGYKFDLRVYVLVTSCDPLRVFIFNNGLLRMCSKKYAVPTSKNSSDLAMHLTNHPIEDQDDFNIDYGKNRTLDFLFGYLEEQKQDVSKFRKEIHNIVLKSIFLVEPYLFTSYRKCRPGSSPNNSSVCFELLGFDILIDNNYKPRVLEINRCPNFDIANQNEFHLKIKLLLDVFNLLHFRVSDRKNSETIEQIEAHNRLYSQLGRTRPMDPLTNLKENLSILRSEQAREEYEKHHTGDFIRLFPVDNEQQMQELFNTLTKCFDVLYTDKANDSSWKTKYFNQWNEQELIDAIARLKKEKSSKKPRPSSSTSHSDGEHRSRSSSIKRVSTQTPSDIPRSISLSSAKTSKHIPASTGIVSKPQVESKRSMPGVSANRITEKKTPYHTQSEEHSDHRSRSSSPKSERSNEKSQMVTYASIIRETRQRLAEQTTSKNIGKELELTEKDFHRLHVLIFDELQKFHLRYPQKSEKETTRIFTEICEHWDYYQIELGQFWLGELDTDKRQSVIDMVWNNVQEIMKKICLIEQLIEQLPLNRQLLKLKRRLLSNHGQPFWDACLERHSSWESLFVKSTTSISKVELHCCYLFVDLCREALFISYRYTKDCRIPKQYSHQGSTNKHIQQHTVDSINLH